MSDMTPYILLTTVVALAAVLYRSLIAIERMSGTATRASAQERRDYFQMMERLVEKKDTPGLQTTQLHAEERVNRIREDAQVDKAARTSTKIFRDDGEEVGTLEESMH